MKRSLIITFLILQACNSLFIQAQQINVRKYSIEDGLVNNDVLKIYQDSRGFIWLCTRGGLSRYDGSRFTNFTTGNGLTNDMINDIYEIAPQEFIIAQNSGGPQLLKDGRIRPLVPGNNLSISKFYPVNNNHLLAGTDFKGVVEWNKGKFRLLDSGYTDNISEITVLNDSLWLVLNAPYYLRLTTPHLQIVSPAVLLPATTIFTDSQHRTWVGTVLGLKLLNPASQTSKTITFLPLPPPFDHPLLRDGFISYFMEDSKGNYWIGTIKGLLKIDRNGVSHLYTQQDGLPEPGIHCITEDRQNNIWVGTTLGVAKFSLHTEINKITPALEWLNDYTMAILPETAYSVHLFDRKNISNLQLSTGKITNRSSAGSDLYQILKVSKTEFMIIKGGKGTIYHSGKKDVETIDWPAQGFGFAIRLNQQNFLGAFNDKLFHISNGRCTEKLSIGANNVAHNMVVDKKNYLWTGTWATGLHKIKLNYDQDSLQLETVDTFISRLPDQHIRVLYADRENELWIGTRYKGVIRLLELPNGKYEIQNYGTAEGLSSDFVLAINRDSAGNIWVGSMQGLDKLILSGNQYRIFNFGRVNKFFSKVYDINFMANNDLLATGYPSLLHARELQQDTLPAFPVYITEISSGPGDSSFLPWPGALRLPSYKAQIYFEFSSPQFINEDFTKYSYRLLGGNDTSWIIATRSRSVHFASLRPGAYTFEVRALGFNGVWGEPASYGFMVNAPFWQKAWFILLMVAAAGMLIYALYRYRVQQLIRLQKVRNRIATDLHDEIGSNLTNISILSNLGRKNLLQPQKAGDFLQRISEEVSSSAQALDDIIWSVNTSHDTLEETVARMRRYAAELFDAVNTGYELDLDPAFEEKKLAMEQRRDIYLLYKEAVNNISKHAGAKQVNIQIAIEHNQLLLCIKDDGKGFDTTMETSRYGLKGMKQRVQKWKGTMVVQSAVQKGTSILIRLPLSK